MFWSIDGETDLITLGTGDEYFNIIANSNTFTAAHRYAEHRVNLSPAGGPAMSYPMIFRIRMVYSFFLIWSYFMRLRQK